ncbi:MAG: hypothetical protein M1812_002935 [Candelaria pacifica]|nr:MAG: hypothetical protein M1812_002935 [Candelaria pacifica]
MTENRFGIPKGQTLGFETSIDTARNRTYGTTPLVGVKRDHAQVKAQAPGMIETAVLSDRTNKLPLNGFKRPELPLHQKCVLKASEIRRVTGAGSHSIEPSEYSQRRAFASTPGPTQNPLLSLSHPRYALPQSLIRNFGSLGINSIYPWQSSCLLGRGLLTGEKNLVYTAPTGGGKSLVADVLMLKRVIDNPGKKSILVLPYVALVQEKLRWLRRCIDGVQKNMESCAQNVAHTLRKHNLGDDGSIRVAGFFGGSKARAHWTNVDIAVCTIESANTLVNTAIEECTANQLGIVVLDELHMIDDDHRGYILELMATKILSLEQGVQIVGMSATLSNTELLAKWLNAKLYESKYRPIPIEEYLVYDHAIYPAPTSSTFLRTATQLSSSSMNSKLDVEPCRIILKSEHAALCDSVSDAVVALASETVRAGYGALIFCSSRKGCENKASLISEVMPDWEEVHPDIMTARKDAMFDLRNTAVGLDACLEKTIPKGVAYHHAGLTTEERDIVQDAYMRGVIKVIVATCSLAAGINLPARRVILHGARMGRDLVGPAMLRQMRGRAGRKGKDEVGESYLCCKKSDLEAVTELIKAELPPVTSCLTEEKRGIKRYAENSMSTVPGTDSEPIRALLEVIVTRLANTTGSIDEYVKRTLLWHSTDHDALERLVKTTLQDLLANSLIILDNIGCFEATTLGKAIVASSLTPEDGIFVYDEFKRALRAFVMDGEMHIFYMFTPVHSSGLGDINWQIFRDQIDKLDESGLRVLDFVGIKPSAVNRLANSGGILKENTPEEINIARIHRRFYAACQLRDLCNEIPVHEVARKYAIDRGFVQNLSQACQGFASGMIKFCERMGWGMLGAVLEHMSDRLKAGAKADLLDLAKVAFIKSRTARVFWESGMKNVRMVAEADPKDLIPILLLAQPKKFNRQRDANDDEKYRQKLLAKAEIIVESANRLWTREMQLDVEE